MLQTIKGKQIERNTILTGGINDHLSIVGNLDFGGFIISSSGMPTNQYDLVNKWSKVLKFTNYFELRDDVTISN